MITTDGYLELILGPMFSGKTSKILELHKQYRFCDVKVIVINHYSDSRYSQTMLSTHDQIMIPCHWVTHLSKMDMNMIENDYQVILINEGQFFTDLVPFVKKALELKKTIYIAGLDGDFQRNKFGTILDLIPLCDKVEKLTSLCNLCRNGTYGLFSLRLTEETCQTVVGGIDNYIPVCRKCYQMKTKEKEESYEEKEKDKYNFQKYNCEK